MTIALTGSAQYRPTAKFKVQFNGSILRGYCQTIDDPLTNRLGLTSIPYSEAGSITETGPDFRRVTLSMRLLTRLQQAADMDHLADIDAQWRDTLAIVARADGQSELFVGDSDRYLPAHFESASRPMTAPGNRAATYSLTFTSKSWYRSTTVTSNYRNSVSTARVSGTANGTVSYVDGRFSGTKAVLADASGEYVSFPPVDNIDLSTGTMCMWLRPQFGSALASDRVVAHVADADDHWNAQWQGSSLRFVLRGSGTAGERTYVTAPALTFASGNNVFLAFSWDSVGSRIYTGILSGSLVESSSATSLFSTVGPTLTAFRIASDGGAVYGDAGVSDFLSFRSALTNAQVNYVFSNSASYDPLDTSLPTHLLLDAPFNNTTVANSSSNNLYLDVPSTRKTAPIIILDGGAGLAMSGTNTDKAFDYTAGATPPVTINCGTFTVLDADGATKVSKMSGVNYGIAFSGSQRASLVATRISGSTNVTIKVTPLYER